MYGEAEDDDEVIVFNPEADPVQPSTQLSEESGSGALGGHANAVLFGNVHMGHNSPELLRIKGTPPKSDSSYASVVSNRTNEYSMFGPSPVALEYSYEQSKTMDPPPAVTTLQQTSMWSTGTPEAKPLLSSLIQQQSPDTQLTSKDPSSALSYLELESDRYEMGASSLSGFFASRTPPPGFETSLTGGNVTDAADETSMYTANPFIIGDT